MPLYEFLCKACGHRFENIQKFSDKQPTICPACGEEEIEQVIHAPAVQFKGSGWYVTDYAKKGGSQSAAASKSENKGEGKSESKGEGKSETKSDATTDAPKKKTEGKKD